MFVKHGCKHYGESASAFLICPSCSPRLYIYYTLIDRVSNNSNNYNYITMDTFARERIEKFYY